MIVMPSQPSFDIVRFCAEEVTRQQDTPEMVYHMLVAWMVAVDRRAAGAPLDVQLIESLGALVHPHANPGGFRRVDVRVGPRLCPRWQDVPALMAEWLGDTCHRLTPEGAYRTFEEIHPFRDGNGRTGKIIYNWLRQTLEAPQMPPNFWGSANP